MNQWVARAAGQWPLGIAVLALFSLFYLPRVVLPDPSKDRGGRAELDRLRREVESDPGAAEPGVAAFIRVRTASPLLGEAQLLLGEAVARQTRGDRFAGAERLQRGWDALSRAQGLGVPRDSVDPFRLEIAGAGLEYGLGKESIDRYSELVRSGGPPALQLELARALARRAALHPGLRQALLDEAAARVSEYLRSAPADRRPAGLLAQIRLCARTGRQDEVLRIAVAALSEARNPDDRARLQLERGRALGRLGRRTESLAALDEAEHLASDPFLKGIAAVEQGSLLLRSGNPEGAELCRRLIASGSPALPFARIALGEARLDAQPGEALDAMLDGLRAIPRPRLLHEAGVDLMALVPALRAAWAREPERGVAVLRELARLHPRDPELSMDQAALYRIAGRHAEAADAYLEAAELGEAESRERALRAAADACFEGRLDARAALLYRRVYELRPEANLDALLHAGLSLKRAGEIEPARSAFAAVGAKPGPLAGAALLEEATLLAEARRFAEAVALYERFPSASSRAEDRAAAELGLARVLLELDRAEDAERAIAGASDSPDVVWLRVRIAVRRHRWRAGLDLLRRFSELAPKERGAAAALEGDLHFELGDYASALRAYEEALSADPDAARRLAALIGRARALARLDRSDDARREYEQALAIYRRSLPAIQETMAGFGPEYWQSALDALAREVR